MRLRHRKTLIDRHCLRYRNPKRQKCVALLQASLVSLPCDQLVVLRKYVLRLLAHL